MNSQVEHWAANDGVLFVYLQEAGVTATTWDMFDTYNYVANMESKGLFRFQNPLSLHAIILGDSRCRSAKTPSFLVLCFVPCSE